MHDYAITVTIPKAPWKFTANEDTMVSIINSCGNLITYQWELNSICQLHVHAHVQSKYSIYITKLLNSLKIKYPDYRVFIEKLKTTADVSKWRNYIIKHSMTKTNELYYLIVSYYRNKSSMIDMDWLADLDIEFNSRTGHFKHLEHKGLWFVDSEIKS